MITVTGKNNIGFTASAKGKKSFKAFNPSEGKYMQEEFFFATEEEVGQIMELTHSAASIYRKKPASERAAFLNAIAAEILALGDLLIQRCMAETGLPQARIMGERTRTVNQLGLFAETLNKGHHAEARIDQAIPDRSPIPKPDLRRMLRPLGPVMVFGASNFPLAFSTAGGDTASALAAGCPVIVKAHSSHPGTNDLIAQAILTAAQDTGMPDGVFSMFYSDRSLAIKVVEHPVVKAVGFTGSRQAGMSIFNAAMTRPDPIPVFAEMSSVNPVFILPGALQENSIKIAEGLATSITNGVGQFCTNPGIVFLIEDAITDAFLKQLAEKIKAAVPATMLNKGICEAYHQGIQRLVKNPVVTQLAISSGTVQPGSISGIPSLFVVKASEFIQQAELQEEVFGPSSLMVVCKNISEMETLLQKMEGQLTASIHASTSELSSLEKLVDMMEEKAGRLLFGEFPTGVEVCASQHHGGPFPASSDSRFTSVGTAAILRFLRPVAYQNFPDSLLPLELKKENPLHITRLVDNSYSS